MAITSRKFQLGLAFLYVLLATRNGRANTETGHNSDAYAIMCNIINMLTNKPERPQTIDEIITMAETIGALNLTAAPSDFTLAIDKDKTWQSLEESKKPTDKEKKQLWTKYYDFWAAAKRRYETAKAEFDTFGGSDLPRHVKSRLAALTEEAFKIRSNDELTKYDKESATYVNAVKQALYGGADKEAANTEDVPNTRANTCGAGGGGGSNKAGISLRRDLTCLCLPETQNQPQNVCCPDCDASGVTAWNDQQAAAKLFTHLSLKCQHYATTQELTSATLNTTLAAFYTKISGIHGSNAKKLFVLGHLDGNGETGCSGASAANAGICVIYKQAAAGPKKPVIPWVEAAQQAAKAADAIAANAKVLEALKLELKILKRTAQTLNITADHHSETAKQPRPDFNSKTFSTEAKCTPQNKTPAECPSEHCDYNSEKKECKAKPTTENTAEGTGDGAAGANSEGKKCSEKTKQEECKDGCKWDGKECKDSSILVNKKFALSVVSAAFMALLF